MTGPEARKRGQVVSGHADESLARILCRWSEIATLVLFEIKQSVRQHVHRFERDTHLIRYGAQIFTDNHAAITLAFKGENP